jgi:protoheme IX farnesyltransferase
MSMPTFVCEPVAQANTRGSALARTWDYIQLTKPKIVLLELVTVLVAGCVARWSVPDAWVLVHAVVGTVLVAASASAWNQWVEQDRDARMERTADRPIPGGRLTSSEVAWFGAVTGVVGVIYLAAAVNPLTAVLGFITWALYVAAYTPLKTRSPLNTVVGAVAGAMPILMGWGAVDGSFGLPAATLFSIVFLWQFPHFMAIAWLYRQQYAAAGMQMLTVVDPTGQRAGVQAVFAALALVPVSLLPSVVNFAGPLYFLWALALGLAQLACAVWFCCRRDELTARVLLRASLVYLPSLLISLLLGPLV